MLAVARVVQETVGVTPAQLPLQHPHQLAEQAGKVLLAEQVLLIPAVVVAVVAITEPAISMVALAVLA
jgi:hypothetical protein